MRARLQHLLPTARRAVLGLIVATTVVATAPAASAAAGCASLGMLCVQPLEAPAASASAARATWSADFSTGDFTQWSWWGQDQRDMWGHISVVDPARYGVPRLPVSASPRVARMAVTADDAAHGRIHAKLYREFAGGDGSRSQPPRDVSGTYSAWYYVPSDYRIRRGASTNLFQFKDAYGGRSDPLWWVQLGSLGWARDLGRTRWLGSARGASGRPVAFLNYWGNRWRRRVTLLPIPLDRWFEVRAELHQRDRIDFSIDGRPFDTARASEYPVSPFHVGSEGWIFGVGNYSSAPRTVLYVGGASYAAG